MKLNNNRAISKLKKMIKNLVIAKKSLMCKMMDPMIFIRKIRLDNNSLQRLKILEKILWFLLDLWGVWALANTIKKKMLTNQMRGY